MDGTGAMVVLLLIMCVVGGLALLINSGPRLPPAPPHQVGAWGQPPHPPGTPQRSAGRIVGGLLLILIGVLGLLFVHGLSHLADVANH